MPGAFCEEQPALESDPGVLRTYESNLFCVPPTSPPKLGILWLTECIFFFLGWGVSRVWHSNWGKYHPHKGPEVSSVQYQLYMILTFLKALPLPQPKSGGKSHRIGPRGPRESQVLNHRRQRSYNAFPLATIHSRSQKPVAHSYPKVRGHCSREDGRLKACDMLGQWSAWTWQQLLRP